LFAGFSGGRKSVLPGISSYKTVMANHCSEFIDSPNARPGILQDNPIDRDMLYAAKTVGLRFIVNVILNSERNIIASFSGDLEAVEEIQRLIEYPDRRIKPLVLTMCSSGIRLGAWEYLKWNHIEPIRRVIDGEDNDRSGIRRGASTWEYLKWNHIEPIRDRMVVAAKITVYAGENEQYFSFIASEAFEALQEWMDFRRTSGEDINGESWLMRTVVGD
jgi:Lactate racemase N-terminal domain